MVKEDVRQLAPGDLFAGFRIESLAGHGGMGLVYRAHQVRPGRLVALKVIAPELARDCDFRARFEQEAALAAEIEHPNVIPVYGVGEEDGLLYIAMRYVACLDLGRLLRREERLAPNDAGRIVAQIAAALDAAHAHGLVHRDVKPTNVLVTGPLPHEHIYLTDFGLTKRVEAEAPAATDGFVGTIDYVAPEQINGAPVDARADVYSLGCVLYQLLTGAVPFLRDRDEAKIYAHLSATPPVPSCVAPTGRTELDAVVARAMAKDPDERFQSAGDLARAAVTAAGGPTAAADPGIAAPSSGSEARTRPGGTAPAAELRAARAELERALAAFAAAYGGDHPRVAAVRSALDGDWMPAVSAQG